MEIIEAQGDLDKEKNIAIIAKPSMTFYHTDFVCILLFIPFFLFAGKTNSNCKLSTGHNDLHFGGKRSLKVER